MDKLTIDAAAEAWAIKAVGAQYYKQNPAEGATLADGFKAGITWFIEQTSNMVGGILTDISQEFIKTNLQEQDSPEP